MNIKEMLFAQLVRRFMKKLTKAEDGCWEWIGDRDGKGYGRIAIDNERWRAHRVSWAIFKGEIPPGQFVLHKCDNRRCVNPDHLFLGSIADNVRDMVEKGRNRNGLEGRTHCAAGHEYTPENTQSKSGGGRRCKECRRLSWTRGARKISIRRKEARLLRKAG